MGKATTVLEVRETGTYQLRLAAVCGDIPEKVIAALSKVEEVKSICYDNSGGWLISLRELAPKSVVLQLQSIVKSTEGVILEDTPLLHDDTSTGGGVIVLDDDTNFVGTS
jgi:hypothetical protein